MFDGSSIEGFVRIEESDMYLHPDSGFFTISLETAAGKVARIICDIYRPDGTPFEGDPRYILRRVVKQAEEMGYVFDVGPECEFFLFNTDDNGCRPQRLPRRLVILRWDRTITARMHGVTWS